MRADDSFGKFTRIAGNFRLAQQIQYVFIGPTRIRLKAFGADHELNRFLNLAGNLSHTHLAGIHTENIDRLRFLFRRIFASDSTQSVAEPDRKSTRLNSSHANISYAVFCLKKKKKKKNKKKKK